MDVFTLMGRIAVENNGAERNIDSVVNRARSAEGEMSNHFTNIGRGFSRAGDKMIKVGNSLTTKVSLPLAAIGTIATKVGMDFEAEMSKVKAISGATGSDFTKLKTKAEEMGSKTKFSASESAEAMEYMAMAGWKTQEMLDGLPPILDLASASGESLASTSDIVTDALTAFGLKAKDAGHFSDILAAASSNSNTNVGMMGETFKYVAPLAGSLGYSAEDTALAIGLMANSGIKASQAGTTLRGALTRLTKPPKKAAKAIGDLGLSLTDSSGKVKPFGKLMEELRGKFKGLDKAQQAQYAATIFGQEAMSGMLAIINASPGDYEKLKNSIENCDGTTKKMADTMESNAKGSVTKMKSALEGAAIKISEAVAPSVIKLADKVSELANKFSSLSPQTQETIVKFAAFAIAAGPAIRTVGVFSKGIGGAVRLMGNFSGGLKLASAATSTAAGATGTATTAVGGLGLAAKAGALLMNPWTLGIAGAGLAIYGLHKHLSKEAVPSVNLFADRIVKTEKVNKNAVGGISKSTQEMSVKISEETKKAVGSYMALDKGAEKSLTDLYVNGTKITKDTSKNLTDTYTQMSTQIKGGMDKHYNEQVKSMQDFFKNSKGISKKEQDEMLNGLKNNNDKQKKEMDGYTKQIQDILKKASDKNRELTLDEQQKINSIQDKMRVNAVNSLSKEEVESKVILERLKGYGKRVTAEQASEVIKNAEKQRQGAVKKAQEQHDQTVRNIIKMRDESKTITKDQADKMLKEAERQKTESIKKADALKQGVVKKIKEQNSQVLKDVDTSSGEILTKWDKLKTWWHNWHPIKKIFGGETKTSSSVGHNWTGTNYWEGGLTTLHEKGYEVYDLPEGTRIFNHEASLDLVKNLAKNLSVGKENTVTKPTIFGMNGNRAMVGGEAGPEAVLPIEKLSGILVDTVKNMGMEKSIIIQLDGRTIARATAPYMSEELSYRNKRRF